MYIVFKVFGTQLEFHNDLKKYYDLSCEFQYSHDKLLKIVNNNFSIKKDPAAIFQTIETWVKKFIGDLINRLTAIDVYYRTTSDYLNTNNGYLQLLNATTSYYEYSKNSTERHHLAAESSKKSTSESIGSAVYGLDFGIISNSIIDHAVYSAMNKAEIQKQSLAAFDRMCVACKAIDSTRDGNIIAEINEYYINEYIPAIITSLSTLYGHLLSTYTNDLNVSGKLNLTCIEHIDLQRSNEIINNIENVDNKQGIFFKAIELCPYNTNAYIKGYSEFLYPQGLSLMDVCGDLIKYFDLEKALNSILVPVSSLCDKAKTSLIKDDYYKAKKSYKEIVSIYPHESFGWIGLLLCETQKFTHIAPDVNIIENLYLKVVNTIDDVELRNNLKDKFEKYKYNIEKYARGLKEKEAIMHQETINQRIIETAQKDCTKWALLTALTGIPAIIALVVVFIVPTAFFLLLLTCGMTAINGIMYKDCKKTIAECCRENLRHSEKEKEISELRDRIINSISVDDILQSM